MQLIAIKYYKNNKINLNLIKYYRYYKNNYYSYQNINPSFAKYNFNNCS